MIKNNEIYEEAQKGLSLIENSIERLLTDRNEGLSNSEIAHMLGLVSSHDGKQINYLTYSVLGNMMKKGLIIKVKDGRIALYRVNK